jgi:hypothetical protein
VGSWKTRSPNTCTAASRWSKIDAEFLRWIWQFNQNIRPSVVEKLNHLDQGKQVVILKSHQQVKHLFNNL